LEAVFTANQLTDTGKQNSTRKYTNQIQLIKPNITKYSKTELPGTVASYDTQPGNETNIF